MPFVAGIWGPLLRNSRLKFGNDCVYFHCLNCGANCAPSAAEMCEPFLRHSGPNSLNQLWAIHCGNVEAISAPFPATNLGANSAPFTVVIWEALLRHSRAKFGKPVCVIHAWGLRAKFALFTVELLEPRSLRGWTLGTNAAPFAVEFWEPRLIHSRLNVCNHVCVAIHGCNLWTAFGPFAVEVW